ncbi:MAG: BON domain-containing protein [Thermoplasmatota archaeon]
MDDERIKKDVVNELYWDAQIDPSDIRTEVTNGIVKLEVYVPTYRKKLAVKMDAWNINGVTSV